MGDKRCLFIDNIAGSSNNRESMKDSHGVLCVQKESPDNQIVVDGNIFTYIISNMV